MTQMIGMPTSWKGAASVEAAKELIDYGVMLRWRDMRTLRRCLTDEEQEQIVRHFAIRFVERANERLQGEILVESALIWLANAGSEALLHAFLKEFFAQAACDRAAWTLVEVALTCELSEGTHEQDIFEMAVALICELGLSVREYEVAYPGEFERAPAFLDHVATYLLSVSNVNSSCIRLSLIHYFGVFEHNSGNPLYFNRIMGRFGHTVLDHLFALLFRKRSEAVALQFLLENLSFVFEADRHSQKIVHETFKFYMLKQPERFCLFIQAFADDLISRDETFDQARRVFLQHLGALLNVASEVNHKQLGREFMVAIAKFRGFAFCDELIQRIRDDAQIRKPFKELMRKLCEGGSSTDVIEAAFQFRSSKRGRKPSFARVENVGTMHQVTYLGAIEVPKAS